MTLRHMLMVPLAVFGCVSGAAALPQGAAQFQIDSPVVNSALGANVESTRAVLAQALADAAKRRFAFVDWVPGSQDAPFGLTLRLVDESVAADAACPPGKLLVLEVYKLSDPQRVGDPVPAFNGCNPEPAYAFDDLSEFEAALRTELDKLADAARATVLQLLSEVAVANEVSFDHGARRVVFPMKLADLQMAEESTLKIEFNRAGSIGKLFFQPWEELEAGIQCKFTYFEFPPDIEVTEPFHWDPSFAEIFPPGDPPALNVFVTEYVPNPHAGDVPFDSDGIVTEFDR